jgi:outer membrane protein assembly factor BamD (BamD/ComL family)
MSAGIVGPASRGFSKDLYDTAQLEEKQFHKTHANETLSAIVEEYPDWPYANQAKTRLAELETAR